LRNGKPTNSARMNGGASSMTTYGNRKISSGRIPYDDNKSLTAVWIGFAVDVVLLALSRRNADEFH